MERSTFGNYVGARDAFVHPRAQFMTVGHEVALVYVVLAISIVLLGTWSRRTVKAYFRLSGAPAHENDSEQI